MEDRAPLRKLDPQTTATRELNSPLMAMVKLLVEVVAPATTPPVTVGVMMAERVMTHRRESLQRHPRHAVVCVVHPTIKLTDARRINRVQRQGHRAKGVAETTSLLTVQTAAVEAANRQGERTVITVPLFPTSA